MEARRRDALDRTDGATPMNLRCTIVLALSAVLLGGCATQRTLPRVREDGDKAFERGQYDKALADYIEYVDRKPGEPVVRHQLAKTFLLVGQPEEAVPHARVAFDQHPERTDYAETLAEALFASHQPDELYAFLRLLIDQRRGVADYMRLGSFAARLGDVDEAEAAFITAAKLDAGRTSGPHLALADLYQTAGDNERAIRRLRMALYVEPGNTQIMTRLRALGEIPGPSLALQPEEWR